MAPFINAVYGGGERKNSQFFLVSDFWGRHGHGGAIPHEGYVCWLMAAISARSLEASDLLDAYAAAAGKYSAHATTQVGREDLNNNAVAQDEASLSLADLLRDYHLRQPTEG